MASVSWKNRKSGGEKKVLGTVSFVEEKKATHTRVKENPVQSMGLLTLVKPRKT